MDTADKAFGKVAGRPVKLPAFAVFVGGQAWDGYYSTKREAENVAVVRASEGRKEVEVWKWVSCIKEKGND